MTMKTEEELNALTKALEELNNKLRELNEEELEQVTGGHPISDVVPKDRDIAMD